MNNIVLNMKNSKLTSEPMFSNGTEAMTWIENNCNNCWKQSRYSEKHDRWVNQKCSIERDIQAQMAGLEINERSYLFVTNNSICPNRQFEKPTVHKKRTPKVQNDLFNI